MIDMEIKINLPYMQFFLWIRMLEESATNVLRDPNLILEKLQTF